MAKKLSDEAAEKRKAQAERKALERANKRARDLIPKEVWVHKDRAEELKIVEIKLQKPPRKKAEK